MLKEKVKRASIALIQGKISHTFKDARSTYNTLAFERIESLYRLKQQEGNDSFAYLFSSKIAKYTGEELEKTVQLMIDTNLPRLIDIFHLSDRILEGITANCPSNDENNNIPADIWLEKRDESEEADYSIKELETNIQNFSLICEKLNNLNLSSNWTNNLEDIVDRRLRLPQWQDNFEVSLVPIQLKWLHVLVLPWISHIQRSVEDVGKCYRNFSLKKLY